MHYDINDLFDAGYGCNDLFQPYEDHELIDAKYTISDIRNYMSFDNENLKKSINKLFRNASKSERLSGKIFVFYFSSQGHL